MQGQLTEVNAVQTFVMAGNATFTIVSQKTGERFTFRVRESSNNRGYFPIHFVSLLTGIDNESDYSYFGCIKQSANGVRFDHAKREKSNITPDAPAAKAFAWLFGKVFHDGRLPGNVEFYHEGKCCRCARKLTVPSSIRSGIGPDCAEQMGIVCE